MRTLGPISQRLWHALSVCVPGALVCAALLVSALPVRGQDVAEAARKAREQKAKEQKAEQHIYTNDDLKHDHILTPTDQARADARKKSLVAPTEQQQEANAGKKSQPQSLGEIARRLRQEKAEREAQEALKKQPSHFPMNLPAEALASPKPVAPAASPRNAIRPPALGSRSTFTAPNFSRPAAPQIFLLRPEPAPVPNRSGPVRKISPFRPRPMIAPKVPARDLPVPVPRISRPAIAAPKRIASSSAAPVDPRRATPGISAGVATPVEVSPLSGKLTRIRVSRGDSWWKLSAEYLGSGARWHELAALNPAGTNPEFLLAGSEVVVPATVAVAPPVRSSASGVVVAVRVQRGDTLWSIARAHLGSGTAWTCLARANAEISNPNLIFPGQQVQLPGACIAQSRP